MLKTLLVLVLLLWPLAASAETTPVAPEAAPAAVVAPEAEPAAVVAPEAAPAAVPVAVEDSGVGYEPADGPPQVTVEKVVNDGDGTTMKVTLKADRAQLVPGTTTRLGLTIDLPKGYFIYWKRPSASNSPEPSLLGSPTVFNVQAPEGFTVRPQPWPLPDRVEKTFPDSPVQDHFLYHDQVMLDAAVEIPEGAVVGADIELKTRVSWQVCDKNSCKFDRFEPVLTLPVAAEGDASAPPEGWRAPFSVNDNLKPVATLEGYKVSAVLSQWPVRPEDQFAAVFTLTPPEGVVLSEPSDKKRIPVLLENVDGVEAAEGDFQGERGIDLLGRYTVKTLEDGRYQVVMPMQAFDYMTPRAEPVVLKGVIQADAKGADGGVVPVKLLVSLDIPTAARGVAVTTAEEAEAAANEALSASAAPAAVGALKGESSDMPLWQALIFALLGGLILNIMPCVLPVLSLKSIALVELANETEKKVRTHALMYTLGVLASFWALAGAIIILKTSGEMVGWGFQFQNPGFVTFMAALIFAASLSMFGVFHIPGISVSPGPHDGEQSSEGLHTSFIHGVLATLLSTPCSAPLLGGALAFALSQPSWVILFIFTVVGFGLALPIVMLATFPGSKRFIPKPGMWMERFKQFVAFFMVGTVVWLLNILASLINSSGLISVLILLTCISFAGWLIGQYTGVLASLKTKLITFAVALVVVGLGVNVLSFDDSSVAVSLESDYIEWQAFKGEETIQLANAGHTVFLDFTAEWCATCKTFEATVIETEAVSAKLRENRVVSVKVDWTRKSKEIERWVRHYGRSSIPLYVVIPAGQPNKPIIMADSITRSGLIDALNEAGPSTAKSKPTSIQAAPETPKLCKNGAERC